MQKIKRLGRFLSQRRRTLKLTQADIADQLGVAQSIISDIENGTHSRFPRSKVLSLATILMIDPDKFANTWINAVSRLDRENMRKEIYEEH